MQHGIIPIIVRQNETPTSNRFAETRLQKNPADVTYAAKKFKTKQNRKSVACSHLTVSNPQKLFLKGGCIERPDNTCILDRTFSF